MILDKLENKDIYLNLNSNLKKAFEFLTNNDIQSLSDGKYEIDSDNVFALVQSYTTKDSKENRWESHQKYIDIQYIGKGDEIICWAPLKELTINEDSLSERDMAFYNEIDHYTELKLKEGYFGIFFPEDGHKPCCTFNKAMEIKKVVVKVKA